MQPKIISSEAHLGEARSLLQQTQSLASPWDYGASISHKGIRNLVYGSLHPVVVRGRRSKVDCCSKHFFRHSKLSLLLPVIRYIQRGKKKKRGIESPWPSIKDEFQDFSLHLHFFSPLSLFLNIIQLILLIQTDLISKIKILDVAARAT